MQVTRSRCITRLPRTAQTLSCRLQSEECGGSAEGRLAEGMLQNQEAGDGIRTHDNHVGNVVLYQLSYTRGTVPQQPRSARKTGQTRGAQEPRIIGRAGVAARSSPGGTGFSAKDGGAGRGGSPNRAPVRSEI